MDLRHIIVVCGIPYIQNPAGNSLTQLFIDSQGFMGIDDLSMLFVKDIPRMINDNNLVPNQQTHLVDIQQRKLQVLLWWKKNLQSSGLAIISAA